jgi:hypothetical protein
VVLSLGLGFSVIACIVLVVVDNVQTFEKTQLKVYEDSALDLAMRMSNWTSATFKVDASAIVERFEQEVVKNWDISDVLQLTVAMLVNSVTLVFLILLFMLYLLPEQALVLDSRSLKGFELFLLFGHVELSFAADCLFVLI